VPSVDENLNPVSIRITYEVDDGGPRHLVDGFNAEVALGNSVNTGARFAQDHDPVTAYRLYGADTVWKVNAQTVVTVDTARSEGNQLESANVSGVLTAVGAAAALSNADPSGNAGRVELVHKDDDLDARAYVDKTGLTFENASADLSPGRSEAGMHATYRLSDNTQVVVDALHSADQTTEAHRSGATADLDIKLWPGAKLQTGLSYVDQTYNAALPAVAQYDIGAVPGTATGAPLNNTGFGFAGQGLLGSPLSGALGLPMTGASDIIEQDYLAANVKLTQRITDDASVYAEYAHTVTGDDGQMAAIGGEYRVNDAERVYVRYEDIDSLTGIYGLGDGARAQQLVAGFDTAYMRDGSVYDEYRLAGTASGQSAADALGMRNLWHLLPGLNLTTSIERQQVLNPSPLPDAPAGLLVGTSTATALALGVDYLASPLWKTSERLEYRFSDQETDWLSTFAVLRKLSQDWSLIARNIYLSTREDLPGEALQTTQQDRMQLGFAYRDTVTNLWNALGRYEYRTDFNNDPLTGTDTRSQILSGVADYHPLRVWEFEGQLAGKIVHELLNATRSDYDALLVAARVTWDLNERWDVGLLASNTSGGGTRDRGTAFEVGYRVIKNLWLSGGLIAGRYADEELFAANSSWRGVYVRVRFKFDETLLETMSSTSGGAPDVAANTPRR
jgi:hypothetical protein